MEIMNLAKDEPQAKKAAVAPHKEELDLDINLIPGAEVTGRNPIGNLIKETYI